MVRRFYKFLKKYFLILIFIFTALTISFSMWKFSTDYKDIGANLFAGFLQLILTLVILDKLIQKNNELERKPRLLSAYEDTRLWTSRILCLLIRISRCAGLEAKIHNEKDLLDIKHIKEIYQNLNLAAPAPTTPPTDFFNWLGMEAKDLQKLGDKILERHSGNLPPEIYANIHTFHEGILLLGFKNLTLIRQMDLKDRIPRPTILECYSPNVDQDEIDSIFKIFHWLEKIYNDNLVYYPNLKRVTQVVKINYGNEKGVSRITKEERELQIAKYLKWSEDK